MEAEGSYSLWSAGLKPGKPVILEVAVREREKTDVPAPPVREGRGQREERGERGREGGRE